MHSEQDTRKILGAQKKYLTNKSSCKAKERTKSYFRKKHANSQINIVKEKKVRSFVSFLQLRRNSMESHFRASSQQKQQKNSRETNICALKIYNNYAHQMYVIRNSAVEFPHKNLPFLWTKPHPHFFPIVVSCLYLNFP